ncbi:hypothetical protein GTY44_42145 [Streptomyces sp. SID5914]|nr:fumarylacetoacetate hydrolase family protein [Streptomyces sp. SID5914]MZG20009.1 hypothetical protein [Streptomyces sp. SID5914]
MSAVTTGPHANTEEPPMRLYSTHAGTARQDASSELAVAASNVPDLEAGPPDRSPDDVPAAGIRTRPPLDDAALLTPVPRPGTVSIVAVNHRTHVQEAAELMKQRGKPYEMPTEPGLASGPSEAIVVPLGAPSRAGREQEGAMVIGRPGCRVSDADRWACAAGRTVVANDVSARDIRSRAMTGGLGVSVGPAQSLDTFESVGTCDPCPVTTDEFTEPLDLAIGATVNVQARAPHPGSRIAIDERGDLAHANRYQSFLAHALASG